ncbi:MAG: phosphatidylserine decarboxylase family protein [Phycisphaerae bacterium]|nr:phosphatidylserine decarboxylase family protein [Phycisphaerae bacterium]
MRIPLTKYGMPQVAVYPAVLLVVILLIGWAINKRIIQPLPGTIVEILLLIVLGWVLSFFRDPPRTIPQDESLLLSPADGVVRDIEILDGVPEFEGKTLRIGIFLSIFNVHINRVPCAVRIDSITYKPGEFRDARDPQATTLNESNAVMMTRLAEPKDRLMVRQVSGAVARRIVCAAQEGGKLNAGEQYGMIKFGSRTELYVPMRDSVQTAVSVGQTVRAGETTLVRYVK